MGKKIVVIGSSNIDLIATVERFPIAGETIRGKLFIQAMGGKGANQALAARRSGGDVQFITSVGNDANGINALQYYDAAGLDVSLALKIDHAPTGTAMILVNDEGENVIVITPGANNYLSEEYVSELSTEISNASIVMLQMEIPLETVRKVCELAKQSNTTVLLNAAPARVIDESLIRLVDILIVNETEIETITGKPVRSIGEEPAMDMLLAMGAKTVILTLGKKGCLVKGQGKTHLVSAFEVTTVDTTAAGDTFCGALVAQLSQGADMVSAVQFATAAAAICVTRMGAQPSIPKEDDIKEFLRTRASLQQPAKTSDL